MQRVDHQMLMGLKARRWMKYGLLLRQLVCLRPAAPRLSLQTTTVKGTGASSLSRARSRSDGASLSIIIPS
eukprot:7426327-Pyramimonas_sp.AAC.1